MFVILLQNISKERNITENQFKIQNETSHVSASQIVRPSSKEISSLLEQFPSHDMEVINRTTPKKHRGFKFAEENVFSVETPSLEPSPAKFPHMTPPSQDGRSPGARTPLSR